MTRETAALFTAGGGPARPSAPSPHRQALADGLEPAISPCHLETAMASRAEVIVAPQLWLLGGGRGPAGSSPDPKPRPRSATPACPFTVVGLALPSPRPPLPTVPQACQGLSPTGWLCPRFQKPVGLGASPAPLRCPCLTHHVLTWDPANGSCFPPEVTEML